MIEIETVGILADEGMPRDLAENVLEKLLEEVNSPDPAKRDEDESLLLWGVHGKQRRVELRTGSLPMNKTGGIQLSNHSAGILADHGWDRFIYITDLPISSYDKPVFSQVNKTGQAVLLSLPAFGAARPRHGVSRELETVLVDGLPSRGVAGESGREEGGSDQDAEITRVRPSRFSVLILLLGMIRCNQPGRLLPALSGCLAAIAATGAFGIFYGSIWELADAISVWRLLGVSSFSVLALSGWLILRNGLWHFVRGSSTWRTRLDNAATVGTILLTTALIYVLALVLMMVLTVVIIPVDYLSGQLQYPAGWSAYLSIAAFTASLGTMAGAIGSNFDKEVEIRSATYSRREHQRRQRSGYYRDQNQ